MWSPPFDDKDGELIAGGDLRLPFRPLGTSLSSMGPMLTRRLLNPVTLPFGAWNHHHHNDNKQYYY